MIINKKDQDVNILLSEKYVFCASVPFQKLLSSPDCLPLQNVPKEQVMEAVKNKIIGQFQVGYICYIDLNQNEAFKDHVERNTISALKKCFP